LWNDKSHFLKETQKETADCRCTTWHSE